MRNGILKQITRATLVVILYLEWNGIADNPVLAQEVQTVPVAAMPQEGDPETLRLLDVVERRARAARDPADVRAMAARLGFDRARIADFVATRIDWEPYQGILRGASGTLLAGAGNSVDRALLVQALIEAGGEQARLVSGTIMEADSAALLEAFAKRRRSAEVAVDLAAMAAETGVDVAILEAHAARRMAEREALLREVMDMAQPAAEWLGTLVGDFPARPIEVPREHVWVQVQEKGIWIDVDPSPVPVRAAEPTPLDAKALAALRREMGVKLVMLLRTGKTVEPTTLMDVSVDLATVLWRSVDFVVVPAERVSPKELREADPKTRLECLKQVKVWLAGLVIDGHRYDALSFDLEGNIYEVDASGAIGAAKTLAHGLSSGFAGLGGALAGGGKRKTAPSLEALALEVTVGGRVHRREILHATPGATLRALPILRVSFLADGAPLPPGDAARRVLRTMADLVPTLRKLLRGETEGLRLPGQKEPATLLLHFADLRRQLQKQIGGIRVQDGPGLVAETLQLFEDVKAGVGVIRRRIDIYENPLRFSGEDAAAKARLAGVADTVLETALLAQAWPGETGKSAWPLLERGRLSGVKASMAERDGRLEVRWGPDAWWDVDPDRGGCVGRTTSGVGQGMVEYIWVEANSLCALSDITGVYAASPAGPQVGRGDASLYGNICALVSGSWPREVVKAKIMELIKNYWAAATEALMGF